MMQTHDIKLKKFLGCMLGVAIGDALGAPVEFMSRDEILWTFGERGISDLHPYRGFAAGCYTDDTQMTIATALGCIDARRIREREGECDAAAVVYRRYLERFETQKDPAQRRGPGRTCLTAVGSGQMGTIQHPINDSKGCGGVMRTAPVGLCVDVAEAFQFGAEFAAITHGHPSGYLTAGFLAEMVAHTIIGRSLSEATEACKARLVRWDGHDETLEMVNLAQKLAKSDEPVEGAIPMIGEGWVGEEALGIALYCALKFPDDFAAGVLASVNHSGDSDSTGAICGAILGAHLGIDAIPERWVEGVEDSEYIRELAAGMFNMTGKGHHGSINECAPN